MHVERVERGFVCCTPYIMGQGFPLSRSFWDGCSCGEDVFFFVCSFVGLPNLVRGGGAKSLSSIVYFFGFVWEVGL